MCVCWKLVEIISHNRVKELKTNTRESYGIGVKGVVEIISLVIIEHH